MDYAQERKASEEILRLVIQKMAAHPAAFTPITYAVWYEHVLGINPALDQSMHQLQADGKPLDNAAISQLYDTHVSDTRWEVSVLRDGMKELLGKLLVAAAESDKQTQLFGNDLQDFGSMLRSRPDIKVLGEMAERMSNSTEVMQGSMSQLHAEMSACKDEIRRLQKELDSARQEAQTDPLTGVFNRRGFEVQVQQLLQDAERLALGACMLMIDVDRFKAINDNYGHVFGDKVIRTLANVLKAQVKGQDLICRQGGEEFAILLPETHLDGALRLAENIRRNIEHGRIKSPVSDMHIDAITVSVGVAEYAEGDSMTQWLDKADKALYLSKQGGRNQVNVYRAV